MPKTISSAEFLPLLDTCQGYISDSTIGFVRPFKVRESEVPGPEDFDADLGGSGTLVSSASVRGILTADHLFDKNKLSESRPFGLILPSSIGRPSQRIVIEGARKIRIGRGADESKGPDLALLLLSPVDGAKLEAAGKVFYNLSKRRKRMLDEPPLLDRGSALVLCGMVYEWTKDVSPEPRFERAKEFRGLYGPVVFAGHREEGGFDYLSVEVRYDGAYTGPKSFAGCSGGSLWQALLKEREESVVIEELLLTGVLFYESPNENDGMTIECHGRESIYEAAVKALENGLPRKRPNA